MFTSDAAIRHSGARSLGLNTTFVPSIPWWEQTVAVTPGRLYRLAGWIRTENVVLAEGPNAGSSSEGPGAHLGTNLNGSVNSAAIRGTTDWTYVTTTVNSGTATQLTVRARLGDFGGANTGRAWFDDIQLVDVTPTEHPISPAWRILVLVYPTTDTVVAGRPATGTMSDSDRQFAVDTATRFVTTDIPQLNSGNMTPELTLRVVTRPLTLSPDGGGGVWPREDDTAPERDPDFDSIIVIWNSDLSYVDTGAPTGTEFTIAGGQTQYTLREQTYSTASLFQMLYAGPNVLKHEWGHSILYFHEALGVGPRPVIDNHAPINSADADNGTSSAGRYVTCPTGRDYTWREEFPGAPISNSVFSNASGFTHDYYSGTAAILESPTQCLGITPQAWRYGGPLTVGADMTPPALSIADAAALERDTGSAELRFPVTLSEPSTTPVSVSYRTVPGSATATDFTPVTGSVTIAPGQVLATVAVPVLGDTGVEGDETFGVQLDDTVNGFLGDGLAAGTIVTDDVLCDGRAATIKGSGGEDVLNGTSGPDVIVGLGGNDRIDGRGGDDRVCGLEGNDLLLGGSGQDVLDGGLGADDRCVDSGSTTVRRGCERTS